MTLPYFIAGVVTKGFGRGSKDLGIPTANFPDDVVEELPKDFKCGIYFGWASVDNGTVHKMVMSVGWNPFYKNIKKSVETHLLHQFNEDFYGALLRVAILGYLRPEKTFSSVEQLVSAIQNDISEAKTILDTEEYFPFRSHSFFQVPANCNSHTL